MAIDLSAATALLLKQLGWTARGGHAAPRIHDLRHTFICRRVRLWHEHGTDIDNAMVTLSTYVGHAKVVSVSRSARLTFVAAGSDDLRVGREFVDRH